MGILIVTAISICWSQPTTARHSLYRNDQNAGNKSVRFRLVGTKSNRDAIGAEVRVDAAGSCSREW